MVPAVAVHWMLVAPVTMNCLLAPGSRSAKPGLTLTWRFVGSTWTLRWLDWAAWVPNVLAAVNAQMSMSSPQFWLGVEACQSAL
ncbi:MAG: hypothetical protein U0R69_04190 [Gaiellales bacterium]